MSFWRTRPINAVLSALALVGALPVLAVEIPADGLDKLPAADIYLLGEIHGDATHHARQARAVVAIKPAALVFEMLSPEQADAAQDVPHSDAELLEAALQWDASGWPDFALYYPIFSAAPDAEVFGAALPIDQVRAAISKGAAEVLGPDAAKFGLTQDLPKDEQSAREAAQGASHCDALPPEMLPGMVEAQRLRDAAFARTALEALAKTGGPVVVITGNGHARSHGMPVAFSAASPETEVLSVGQLYGVTEDAPFDLWVVSDTPATPARDGDPCDAFKS